jgi:hypothetical protein
MRRATIALTVLGLILGGCAAPPVNYYYGKYSQTLYRSKKDSSPESVARHRATLEDIIQTSEKKGSRVPPGIYCEYGYALALQGNQDADRFFELEVKTYPESARFVTFIREQLKRAPSSE